MAEKRKNLSGYYAATFLIGLGFFTMGLMDPLYDNYIPMFLGYYIESSSVIGTVMTLDNILAIFLIPVFSALSDRTRTRIGRRMPYIITLLPLTAIFFALEAAGAFEDDVDAVFAPLQIVRILLAEDRDLVAFEDEVVLDDVAGFVFFDFGRDLIGVPGVLGGVVLEKVGESLRIDEVVDGDDFKATALISAAESETADAAEPVDC